MSKYCECIRPVLNGLIPDSTICMNCSKETDQKYAYAKVFITQEICACCEKKVTTRTYSPPFVCISCEETKYEKEQKTKKEELKTKTIFERLKKLLGLNK